MRGLSRLATLAAFSRLAKLAFSTERWIKLLILFQISAGMKDGGERVLRTSAVLQKELAPGPLRAEHGSLAPY